MIHRSSFKKKRSYFHLAAQISNRRLSPYQIENLWVDLAKRLSRHSYISVHSCVLMSNHFHALVEVADFYVELAESALRAELFQVQDLELRIANQLDSSKTIRLQKIACFAAYREVYRYIYRNPVQAGIVGRAEYYSYSTLGEILGLRKPVYYVNDMMGMITNPFQVLDWLNQQDQSEARQTSAIF